MLKNYIKIAWRNLTKNKIASFINVGGLAIGMAVAMLIGLWIFQELSFNKIHTNYKRIAQVMQHQNYSGVIQTDKAMPIPLAAELRSRYGSDFNQVVLSS